MKTILGILMAVFVCASVQAQAPFRRNYYTTNSVPDAGVANVKAYGALGDGILTAGVWSGTDDTVAISNAVKNSVVYFPPGNYLTKTLFPTNGHIYGAGAPSRLILLTPGVTTNLIDTGRNQVSISGMSMDGNTTNYVNKQDVNASAAFQSTAILHWSVGESIVKNVYIKDFAFGVLCQGTNDTGGRPQGAMYQGNIITNCWWGFYLPKTNAAEYVSFIGNQIRGGNYGFWNATAANTLVVGNEIVDTYRSVHIEPSPTGLAPYRAHSLYVGNIMNHANIAIVGKNAMNCSFLNNEVLGNTQVIYLDNCTNFVFSDNIFESGTISLVNGGRTNLFRDNTFLGSPAMSGNTTNNSWFMGNRSATLGPVLDSIHQSSAGFSGSLSNLLAPTSLTFPATTVNWTNPLPVSIQVIIDNSVITGTAIKKNGTTISSQTVGTTTVGLQVGEYFSETYTVGTPTAVYFPYP